MIPGSLKEQKIAKTLARKIIADEKYTSFEST